MTAHLDRLKCQLYRTLLDFLFLPAPKILQNQVNYGFIEEQILSKNREHDIPVLEPPENISKVDLLVYLEEEKQMLFHGTNQAEIKLLNPVNRENYRGEKIDAVFASGDPIWAMFFAILDREGYQGSLRNGSFILSCDGVDCERYYFFSINNEMVVNHPWKTGMVYITLRDSFTQTNNGIIRFDEWASEKPVIPLAKLDISPSDFPFINQVSAHHEWESIYLTWLLYKRRLRSKNI
jgi:hypothetical protein